MEDKKFEYIVDIFANESYIRANKILIKKVGILASLMYGELFSEYYYWRGKNQIKDGWFFSTIENVEDATGLSRYQQTQAIEKLIKSNLIKTKNVGLPARRYFYIEFANMIDLFQQYNKERMQETDKLDCEFFTNKDAKNLQTTMQETDKLDCEKLTSNNNNIITIINNNKANKDVVVDVKDAETDFNTIQEKIKEIKEEQNNDKVIKALNEFAPFNTGSITLSYLNDYDISDDLKVYAIKKWAGNSNNTNLLKPNYLEGILKNIKKSGATTVEELEAYENENKKSNSDRWYELQKQQVELKKKELDLKEKNRPYYQMQIEMQSGKAEQKQQKDDEAKKQSELKAKYHDDYIAGKITQEEAKELGLNQSTIEDLEYEIFCNDPINQQIEKDWEEKRAKEEQRKRNERRYKKW